MQATDISKFSEFKDLLNSFVIQFTKDLGGLIDLLSQRKNMIDAFISPYFDYDMYRYLFPDLVYIVKVINIKANLYLQLVMQLFFLIFQRDYQRV